MDETRFNTPGEQRKIDSIAADILRNVRINRNFILWMGFLSAVLVLCLAAYVIQLRKGLGVTGMRDSAPAMREPMTRSAPFSASTHNCGKCSGG